MSSCSLLFGLILYLLVAEEKGREKCHRQALPSPFPFSLIGLAVTSLLSPFPFYPFPAPAAREREDKGEREGTAAGKGMSRLEESGRYPFPSLPLTPSTTTVLPSFPFGQCRGG